MAKKLSGKLVEWNGDRGYGFVRSGAARVFVHRRDFSGCRKAIEVGDQLMFVMGKDEKGRACATDVEHVGHGGELSYAAVFVWVGLSVLPIFAMAVHARYGLWVAGYLGVINAFTALVYWADKRAARQGNWRVSEAKLHFLELLGGWPAAFLFQRMLRHKVSKGSYQLVFWLIVCAYQFAAFDVLTGGSVTSRIWEIVRHSLG